MNCFKQPGYRIALSRGDYSQLFKSQCVKAHYVFLISSFLLARKWIVVKGKVKFNSVY